MELDGATRIRDLETEFGIEIPADAGFETLAGFLLFRLGDIPQRRRMQSSTRAGATPSWKWTAIASRACASRSCQPA